MSLPSPPARVLGFPLHKRVIKPLRCTAQVRERGLFMLREQIGPSRTHTYHLAASGLRFWYRHPFVDQWVLDEIFGREVYRPPTEVLEVLPASPRILDIGAHIGLASLYFATAFPGASLHVVEPSPGNLRLLRKVRDHNPIRMEVTEAAAGTKEGTIGFVDDGHKSHTEAAANGSTRLIDVHELLKEADLVKMDIQGGEWDILGDPRFKETPARAVVLEYHPAMTGERDVRGLARRLLTEAGYTVGEPFDERYGEGTVWAWRT